MKVCSFILCCVFCLSLAVAQPPMPNAHGAWNEKVTVETPYRQLYRYDIKTERFVPYGNTTPVSTATVLLLSLACLYTAARIYRNRKRE